MLGNTRKPYPQSLEHHPGARIRGEPEMSDKRSSYSYEDLLACGRGELFGQGNAQLPRQRMLMFNRIDAVEEAGGMCGKGFFRAILDITPDLWFFPVHFRGDPVMPGCL